MIRLFVKPVLETLTLGLLGNSPRISNGDDFWYPMEGQKMMLSQHLFTLYLRSSVLLVVKEKEELASLTCQAHR